MAIRDWNAFIEPDILGRLAHESKEMGVFQGRDRSFLMQMKHYLERGFKITEKQVAYIEKLLKIAYQEGLLSYLDEPISPTPGGSGVAVKEPPRDLELHKKIGPTQGYDDDL